MEKLVTLHNESKHPLTVVVGDREFQAEPFGPLVLPARFVDIVVNRGYRLRREEIPVEEQVTITADSMVDDSREEAKKALLTENAALRSDRERLAAQLLELQRSAALASERVSELEQLLAAAEQNVASKQAQLDEAVQSLAATKASEQREADGQSEPKLQAETEPTKRKR